MDVYLVYSISIIFLNERNSLNEPYSLIKSFLCSSNNSINPSIPPIISHHVFSSILLANSFSKVLLKILRIFYPPPFDDGIAPSVININAERV